MKQMCEVPHPLHNHQRTAERDQQKQSRKTPRPIAKKYGTGRLQPPQIKLAPLIHPVHRQRQSIVRSQQIITLPKITHVGQIRQLQIIATD